MTSSINLISAENFINDVIEERRPLLLLCASNNDRYKYQIDLIEKISLNYKGLLKIGLLEETFFTAFRKNYRIVGTPTFLILFAGKEKSRFVGHADEAALKDFLDNSSIFQ